MTYYYSSSHNKYSVRDILKKNETSVTRHLSRVYDFTSSKIIQLNAVRGSCEIISENFFGYLTVKDMIDKWFTNATSFGQQTAPWEGSDSQKLYWVVMRRN